MDFRPLFSIRISESQGIFKNRFPGGVRVICRLYHECKLDRSDGFDVNRRFAQGRNRLVVYGTDGRRRHEQTYRTACVQPPPHRILLFFNPELLTQATDIYAIVV